MAAKTSLLTTAPMLSAVLALCAAAAQYADAALVSASVVDAAGAPVGGAVIALFATSGTPLPPPVNATLALDQVRKQFKPHVLALQVSTAVHFPNSDNIRHEVYSFSDAKRFEIKLYSGKSAAPVVFDKPGVVVLGCNIHDWMRAYLYVLDTPFFATTDDAGRATIEAPIGEYSVKTWHPRYEEGRTPLIAPYQISHAQEQLHETLPLSAEDVSSGVPPSLREGGRSQ